MLDGRWTPWIPQLAASCCRELTVRAHFALCLQRKNVCFVLPDKNSNTYLPLIYTLIKVEYRRHQTSYY